jgi:hypothetical protein
VASKDAALAGLDWGLAQPHVRSYADDIVARLKKLPADFQIEQYGDIAYASYRYPVFFVRVGDWQNTDRPIILITSVVHGNEEAGGGASLDFLETTVHDYTDHYNFLVYPCISPSAYEINSRWNMREQDPNRGFKPNSDIAECRAFVESVAKFNRRFLLTMDLHETIPGLNVVMREYFLKHGKPNIDIWDAGAPAEFYLYESCPKIEDRLGPACEGGRGNYAGMQME